MHKAQIFPSLMSADLVNLKMTIEMLEPHCDGFHIDIMDNHFVPNLTWGAQLTNEIARVTTRPLLVHLMVEKPETIVEKLILTPKSIIAFHLEATHKVEHTIDLIKKANYIPSIAIKPNTPLLTLLPFLDAGLSHVLLMSVEPGFSGQTFMANSLERLKELATYKEQTKKEFIICMDGGINKDIIGKLYQDGAQQFAVASAIFGTQNPVKALKELYQRAQ